jgi:hypothetical protein
MVRQTIYIPKYDWDVVVFYESDYRDAPAILKEMDEIGVDEYTFIRAKANLRKGKEDTGLTFTNAKERTSVIVLSATSSKAEFANTWFHEVFHCAVHIAQACGLDYEGEAIAYVGGELARDMQPVAARLMCPTCK